MSTAPKKEIYFGPFEVTDQVFYNSTLCYALVNIKPILPGHTLVIPYRHVKRLTDLTPAELSDVFTLVQRVQKMLAKTYFTSASTDSTNEDIVSEGSFNVALQDGPEAGQTVPHVHVHIIPRTKTAENEGDGFYERLQSEEGNVGGGFWDQARPVQRGKFPKIADEDRLPREKEEMNREARFFREQMELLN